MDCYSRCGSLNCLCFAMRYFMSTLVMAEEGRSCFACFVFLVSRDWCVALPRGEMGLSWVCDCGISWSYSLFLTRHWNSELYMWLRNYRLCWIEQIKAIHLM